MTQIVNVSELSTGLELACQSLRIMVFRNELPN